MKVHIGGYVVEQEPNDMIEHRESSTPRAGADDRPRIIIEPSADTFAAWSPDIPGCYAVGDTREETERNMQRSIRLYMGLIARQHTLPEGPQQDSAAE